ncbi:MAG: hypothetical protein KAT37_02940 [Candidatus Aenigmarchaeota archaeon]|nr:hypothetical protein [Candidatus Aenigmarchaeota archaeon]
MPFTPFHLGPGFLLGLIFRRWVNLAAILVASVIVDVRATYCLFTGCYPLHGPLHTFLGATILSLAVIIGVYVFRDQLKRISDFFKIEQDYSLQSIAIGSLLGVWVHIILDTFLYPEMHPFWPVPGNPLVGIVGSNAVYGFCIAGFIIGGAILLFKAIEK